MSKCSCRLDICLPMYHCLAKASEKCARPRNAHCLWIVIGNSAVLWLQDLGSLLYKSAQCGIKTETGRQLDRMDRCYQVRNLPASPKLCSHICLCTCIFARLTFHRGLSIPQLPCCFSAAKGVSMSLGSYGNWLLMSPEQGNEVRMLLLYWTVFRGAGR